MTTMLHLISRVDFDAWRALPASEPLKPASLAREGFIHCTAGDDLMLAVANLFYKDQAGEFLALEIDESKVTAPVKWEAPAPPSPVGDGGVRTDPNAMPPEVKAEIGSVPPEPVERKPVERQPVEPAPSAPAPIFPHIYGPLNRDAVIGTRTLLRAADGAFTGYAPIAEKAEPAPPEPIRDSNNPLNIKTPSQMAQELLDATDEFSESLKRFKDSVEGRMAEIDEKIKKL